MQDQLEEELSKLLKHGLKILRKFGFKEYKIYLSTRPEKYAGTEEGWKKATKALETVLNNHKIDYDIDNGGVFFMDQRLILKLKIA